MYTRPKIEADNAQDVADALGALVFAIGITFPAPMARQLADAIRSCAGPGPARTSAQTLIESLADGMEQASRIATPPH